MFPPDVTFDLRGLMRAHRMTVRALAAKMDIPAARIWDLRAAATVPYFTYCEFVQAVTGRDIFDATYWDHYRSR